MIMKNKIKELCYWEVRSKKYNNLKWVSDKSYMDNLIDCLDLDDSYLVLDVGAGTGAVSNNIKNNVTSVFAMDISNIMLRENNWSGVSAIEWDIRKPLFDKNIFDRVVARMVFHHILENIDDAFNNCYNYLKEGGKMVIAEAIPPFNSQIVVDWFTEMFSYKEDRITFVPGQIEQYLKDAGFLEVNSFFFSMPNFSINNWIENSGLYMNEINNILKMHIDAPQEVKNAYEMRIDGDQILINSKYTIVVGKK